MDADAASHDRIFIALRNTSGCVAMPPVTQCYRQIPGPNVQTSIVTTMRQIVRNSLVTAFKRGL
jgi:hypothetical protein